MVAARSRTPRATDPAAFDLGDPATYQLVGRIFNGRFAGRLQSSGVDPEDALQSVYVGLLSRSAGRSRWDPSRGSLSTWVYVATSGIVSNLLDSHRRTLRRDGGLGREEDAAASWRGPTVEADLGPRALAEIDAELGGAVGAELAGEPLRPASAAPLQRARSRRLALVPSQESPVAAESSRPTPKSQAAPTAPTAPPVKIPLARLVRLTGELVRAAPGGISRVEADRAGQELLAIALGMVGQTLPEEVEAAA